MLFQRIASTQKSTASSLHLVCSTHTVQLRNCRKLPDQQPYRQESLYTSMQHFYEYLIRVGREVQQQAVPIASDADAARSFFGSVFSWLNLPICAGLLAPAACLYSLKGEDEKRNGGKLDWTTVMWNYAFGKRENRRNVETVAVLTFFLTLPDPLFSSILHSIYYRFDSSPIYCSVTRTIPHWQNDRIKTALYTFLYSRAIQCIV